MPPDRPLNALDDFELLQVLVGRRLREQEAPYETLRDLVDRTLDQLRHELGVGPAGARRIAAAVELHRRVSSARHDRAPMRSPEEVLALLGPELATLEVERSPSRFAAAGNPSRGKRDAPTEKSRDGSRTTRIDDSRAPAQGRSHGVAG